jgi:hypothetical protein
MVNKSHLIKLILDANKAMEANHRRRQELVAIIENQHLRNICDHEIEDAELRQLEFKLHQYLQIQAALTNLLHVEIPQNTLMN